MRSDLQEAIDLVDNVCAQAQMTRVNHLTVLKALEMIRAELEKPIDNELADFMAAK